MGYHPRNVNKIVTNNAIKLTVMSGFLPLVAIRTTTISPIVNMSENIIPASVEVVPKAKAILASQSDQTTILIR